MEKKETYYSKNKDKVKEYQRKRYPAIKQKIKKYNHEYYEANKPIIELHRQLRSLTNNIILLESKIDLIIKTMIINIVKNKINNKIDGNKIVDIEKIQNQPIIIETTSIPKQKKPKSHKIQLDSLVISFD